MVREFGSIKALMTETFSFVLLELLSEPANSAFRFPEASRVDVPEFVELQRKGLEDLRVNESLVTRERPKAAATRAGPYGQAKSTVSEPSHYLPSPQDFV
eukprot:GHVP01026622.1.p1 GENE.GHVP01026622.1~~GHVP01026622.1.p1  ORF type:complete len:100 (+),score=14.13 GHVP01026622.1:1120-1419(+)